MKKIFVGFVILLLLAGVSIGWGQKCNAKAATYNKAYAKEVVRLVNVERQKRGLSKLKVKSSVTLAAQIRAKESKTSFSHIRPNKKPWYTVLQQKKVKYQMAGENIAYGQKSPKAVVKAWMNSAGHRRNILTKSYRWIGVGAYKKSGRIYWAQEFVG